MAAFGTSKAGDAMAALLGKDVPRLRPKGGKNWNEELTLKKTSSSASAKQFDVDLRLQAELQKKKVKKREREGLGY